MAPKTALGAADAAPAQVLVVGEALIDVVHRQDGTVDEHPGGSPANVAITLGRLDVAGVMAFYALYLASWAGLGLSLGLGRLFLAGIAVAAAQAMWHFALIRERSREGCFKAFRLNHWVGFAVFAGVALDLSLR